MSTIQYKVVYGKKDEVVDGPTDADLVVEVAAADALADPAVSFMQGKLRATGHTGVLFDALKSGEIAESLARIASRSAR